MKKIDLSIILPALEEEETIEGTIKSVDKYLENEFPKLNYEIIVVAAGEGTTAKIAQNMKNINTTVYNPKDVVGKGRDVILGVEHSIGEIIMFIDSDLDIPVENIGKVVNELLLNADSMIAIGSKQKLHSRFSRRISSRTLRVLNRYVLGVAQSDTQCGLKAFRKKQAKELFGNLQTRGWLFDVEILWKAKKQNYEVVEIPITDWKSSDEGLLKDSKVKTSYELSKELLRLIYVTRAKSAVISFTAFIHEHMRPITYILGSSIVAVWTIIRHISNGINFDIVGQMVLTNQISNGFHEGSIVGATHYLLKMPIYHLLNQLTLISPRGRLLLVILIFNILTFVFAVYIFEKFSDLLGKKKKEWLFIGAVWIASIFGAILWLDYPNSRNLEVVGGLAILYITTKYLLRPTRTTLAILLIIMTLVYFSDPLQLYMVGVPVIGLSFLWALFKRRRQDMVLAVHVLAVSLAALFISKLSLGIITDNLSITLLRAPVSVDLFSIANFKTMLFNTINSTAEIFDADFYKSPIDLYSVRELFNAVLLILPLAAILTMARKSKEALLVLLLIGATYGVYIVSGAVLDDQNTRYLILVPFYAWLAVALWGGKVIKNNQTVLKTAYIATLGLAVAILCGALLVSIPDRYSKDSFAQSTVDYMMAQGISRAYTSRPVALPATYLAGTSKIQLFPLACTESNTLTKDKLFFDKAAFKIIEQEQELVIIVPPGGIRFGERYCTQEEIIFAYGRPKHILSAGGVGTVLIYDNESLIIN